MKGSGKTRHAKSWPSPQLAAGPAHVAGCSLLLQLVSMIMEITLVAIDHVTDDNNFEISCGNVSVECVDRTLFPQRLYPTLTFSFITILQRPIFSFPFSPLLQASCLMNMSLSVSLWLYPAPHCRLHIWSRPSCCSGGRMRTDAARAMNATSAASSSPPPITSLPASLGMSAADNAMFRSNNPA